MVYKEFILHKTIKQNVQYIRKCDQTYHNAPENYDHLGFRRLTPDWNEEREYYGFKAFILLLL